MTEDNEQDKPMATPSYRAWAKREASIRAAKDVAWAAIQSVYRELARAEQTAHDVYEDELREINREQMSLFERAA